MANISITVVGAISFKKVVRLITLAGSIKGKEVKVFIEQFLVPYLWKEAVKVNRIAIHIFSLISLHYGCVS